MFNNVNIISETINRLIILLQSEQNIFLTTNNALTKVIINGKIEAYNNAIQILQEQLEQIDG